MLVLKFKNHLEVIFLTNADGVFHRSKNNFLILPKQQHHPILKTTMPSAIVDVICPPNYTPPTYALQALYKLNYWPDWLCHIGRCYLAFQ
jgi:hypothetical protein